MEMPPFDSPADQTFIQVGSFPPDKRPASQPWMTALAWLVIAIVSLVVVVGNLLVSQTAPAADDVGVDVLVEIQAKYYIGVSNLGMNDPRFYQQTKATGNIGAVSQRLGFVVLAAELAGPDEAWSVLEELQVLIEHPTRGDPPVLTTEQERILRIMHGLYAPGEQTLAQRTDQLSDDDRQLMVDQLRWLGELALAPAPEAGNPPSAERQSVLRAASGLAIGLFGVLGAGAIVGLAGFVGLIVVLVFVLRRTIKTRIHFAGRHHGIYAETFAVWIALFFGLQVVVGLVVQPSAPATLTLGLQIAAFFFSLAALMWPIFRGIPWRQVRQEIGWTTGRGAALEAVFGAAGYAMALPLLLIGMILVFILLLIQGALMGDQPTFAPGGGPVHPVILEVASGDIWVGLMILFLAAVAAPIVEETMFRGVLYRHLRDASRSVGLIGSLIISAIVNSFIFAAIHPQGLVAVPALMALAIAFSLMREWRGTIIPSMLMHGISNGLLIGLFILAVG